jgi:hypothetical protein
MGINIAKNQHIVPKRSLERFSNFSGAIEVSRIGQIRSFQTSPKNPVFCFNRAWDHKAEALEGKRIEDSFQGVVDRAIQAGTYQLVSSDSIEVTKFFALWLYRSQAMEFDVGGVHPALTPSAADKDEKLRLEALGVNFVDETGTFPSHVKRGWFVCGGVMSFLDRYMDLKWFMSRGTHYEFLIADNPVEKLFIPISPELCLVAGQSWPVLTAEQCKQANLLAMAGAKKFYCARDLSRCV